MPPWQPSVNSPHYQKAIYANHQSDIRNYQYGMRGIVHPFEHSSGKGKNSHEPSLRFSLPKVLQLKGKLVQNQPIRRPTVDFLVVNFDYHRIALSCVSSGPNIRTGVEHYLGRCTHRHLLHRCHMENASLCQKPLGNMYHGDQTTDHIRFGCPVGLASTDNQLS